jgi:hypothetical protein
MSSKKPFDYIEEKIKQAAENSLPVFDEKAWQAMEAKLDGDKKKRRPLLWWFLLPLLIAGAGLVYYNLDNKNAAGERGNPATAKATGNNTKEDNGTKPPAAAGNTASATNNETAPVSNTPVVQNENGGHQEKEHIPTKENTTTATDNTALSSLVKTKKIAYHKKGKLSATSSGGATGTIDEASTAAYAKDTDKDELKNTTPIHNEVAEAAEKEKDQKETAVAVKKESEKEQKQPIAEKNDSAATEQKPATAKREKEKTKKSNGLYMLASVGPDAGNTKLFSFSNSSITPKYGLGIGYQFNKKWSVQTGFYAANKKYVAGPKDYTIKTGSPMANYQIDKIKASCLVYEIPLTVKYDIINKPAVIFYATAGMSSYILQKEQYDCFYRYYNTQYEQEWQYSGNKNLFSVANFSIGIEKKLSAQFSLLAEPSFSIPVSGIGDGKVKLYSTALQLGMKYYLFKKQ